MSKTKLQSTQSVLEIVLSELGNLSRDQLDVICSKINDALKVPGSFSCVGTNRIVTVSPTTVTLPTGKKEILSIGTTPVDNLTGTLDFDTGLGTIDVQSVTLPSMTASYWIKAGFEVRLDKKIYVSFGTEGDTEDSATYPSFSSECLPLGYIALQDNGTGGQGNFKNITLSKLYQIAGPTPRYELHSSLDGRSEADQHPTSSITTNTTEFSGELSSSEDTAQKAFVRLSQFSSIFDWVTAKSYRIGNQVKANGTIYRCLIAHVSGVFATDLSGGKWELIVSSQDHSTLSNRNAANQHPTSSVDTNTTEFSGELSSSEDTAQKAFVRLEQFNSVFYWATSKSYRVGNQVKANGTIYRCLVAHVSDVFATDLSGGKWELVVSSQDHSTLANRNAANQHPTTSIDTTTSDFSGELSSSEDTVQKAFVRLEQFSSIFDWVTAKSYRVGNQVKANGTIYRCLIAHVSGVFATDLSGGKWELIVSSQDHSTLANRNAANQHPTSSVDTNTTEFSGELSSSEDTAQKAFVRLEQFSSIFDWVTAKSYRVGNQVKSNGTLYRCLIAHVAGVFATDLSGGKWELVVSSQDHSTLANRNAANQHPTSSIDTNVSEFSYQLSANEDTAQKAFVRLDEYNSIFNWASSKSYRIGNVVIYDGTIWLCISAHVSTASFDESKWQLAFSAPQEEMQTVGVGGKTVFTLSTVTIPTARTRLMVFVNGVYQKYISHYVVDSATQVTFTESIPEHAEVIFRVS